MKIKTTRTEIMVVRITQENLAAANKTAALTGRTLSSLAEYALMLYLRKNYPLAYSPNAKLVLRLEEAPSESPEETAPPVTIRDLNLTYRTQQCLEAERISTVSQLVTWSGASLLKTPNLGSKSLNEITGKLISLKLALATPDAETRQQDAKPWGG